MSIPLNRRVESSITLPERGRSLADTGLNMEQR